MLKDPARGEEATLVKAARLERARKEALIAVAKCLQRDQQAGPRGHASYQEQVLQDGTVRRTVGARSVRGTSEPLATTSSCTVGESDASDTLRAIVDAATRRLTRRSSSDTATRAIGLT